MMPYRTAVPIIGSCAVADPGEGPEEPPPASLTLGPNWEPKSRKMCFKTVPPPPLSQGLDESPSPPLSKGLDPPLLCTAMRIYLSFLSNIFSFKRESVYDRICLVYLCWRVSDLFFHILSIFPFQFLCFTSFPPLPFIATLSIYIILWLLHKFSNICKPEEGWYGQPKYCYKKQYTLF